MADITDDGPMELAGIAQFTEQGKYVITIYFEHKPSRPRREYTKVQGAYCVDPIAYQVCRLKDVARDTN